MSDIILGIFNEEDAGSLLLSSLQTLESSPYAPVGMATLNAGKVTVNTQQQSRVTRYSKRSLTQLLIKKEIENEVLVGPIGLAYGRSQLAQNNDIKPHRADFYANRTLAISFYGFIENAYEARESLIQLGYPSLKSEAQLIHYLIKHYSSITGITPLDALNITLSRLMGEFVIFALNAQPEMLVIGRKRCPLFISLHKKSYYFSSDVNCFKHFSSPQLQLEDGTNAILHFKWKA